MQGRADWARIRALDPGAGALGRELEAVRLIARGRADDAPILHTLFSPLTMARKLAGDRLVEDLRQEPAAVEPALDAIADTMARHARAALEAGADGLFFATQTAAPDVVTPEENARFDLPRMRRMLAAVAGALRVHAAPRPRPRHLLRPGGRAAGPRGELARPADRAHGSAMRTAASRARSWAGSARAGRS